MQNRSLYITGTDTGVGKTAVTAALLRGLAGAGWRAAGMKPLASGCERVAGRWVNEDALRLIEASVPNLDYATVNPIALPAATAPEIAAAKVGVRVELPPLCAAHARLLQQADAVLVEGVGGWMAPLSDCLMQADLVRALGVPVLLVVGLRLGCINHALLSLRAIRDDGFEVLGWVGSAVDPRFDFAEEYRAILHRRLDLPCLGILEHGAEELPAAPLVEALRQQADRDRS
ncbi:MAG: ATP-dependent dethiobiotin synthetase BioD [Lysobacteraceae bacterium]|nr:MAG: ATP-dependent dethiobiotin synthetase BioD [Xanthomonadaceae bacterium]